MARALLVQSGQTLLAIPTDQARCEVVECGALTGLPGAAPLLLGLGVLSGQATPVVDLPYMLGDAPLAWAGAGEANQGQLGGSQVAGSQLGSQLTVLAEIAGERLALPVDAALGLQMVAVPDRAFRAAPAGSTPGPSGRLGIFGTPVTLPDPAGAGEVSVLPLDPQALLGRVRQHLERL